MPGRPLPWIIAPVVALAAFMEVLDISIANVALPHIAGSLSAGESEATWVLTSYLIANAIALPVSGWLATALGRKRFFAGCIAGFTASSLLCGLAPDLESLIAFRVLQGATGGGLQPVSQAILSDAFPPEKRGMAFAFYGLAVVFAPAIGPTLGGWITDEWSWRWVFLINVPVGLVLSMLVARLVEDPPAQRAATRALRAGGLRIDYVGFGLLALGLGCLQLVLDTGERENWFESGSIVLYSVLAGTGLVAFVVWELARREPIVDLRLLASRNFAIATLLMFMLGFVLFASTALLPLMVQTLLGYPAVDAGLVVSPGGFAIMAMMPLIGLLTTRVDLRWLIITGLLTAAFALVSLSRFSLGVDYWTIAVTRLVQAIGLGFLFIPINTAAFLDVPPHLTNYASALINLARNLGGSVGIALLATELQRLGQQHRAYLAEHIAPGEPAYEAWMATLGERLDRLSADPVQVEQLASTVVDRTLDAQARMLAYVDDFQLLGLVFLSLIPLALLLRPSPGEAEEGGGEEERLGQTGREDGRKGAGRAPNAGAPKAADEEETQA